MSLKRFARVAFVVLAIVIAIIAFLPNYDALPEVVSISDVLNHFGAFFVLAVLLDYGFSPSKVRQIGILFAYGFFIEAVQYFLPNRMFDLLDLVVDMAGVLAWFGAKTLLMKILLIKPV